MAFGFRQSKAGGGASSPFGQTFSSNILAGSLLIAVIYWNSAGTCTVVESTNGSLTSSGTRVDGVGALSGYHLEVFYFINTVASSSPTVTATISGGTSDIGSAIHEYTGTNVQLDGTPVNSNFTGSTTVTSDAIVTNVDGDLLWCAGVTSNSAGAAGAGFVKREGASFANNITEDDLDGGTAGSKTATFAVAGSGDNTMVGFVAFREGDLPSSGVQIAWIKG